MIDFLVDTFKQILTAILVLIVLTLPVTFEYVAYYFNKATVKVYVDNTCIYSGPSHFVSLKFSEYNSTKEVRVYSDITRLTLIKKYVADNVKMVTVNEM